MRNLGGILWVPPFLFVPIPIRLFLLLLLLVAPPSRAAPLPSAAPTPFLVEEGTAWAAMEWDREGRQGVLGLQPLQSVAVQLRQDRGADGVGDADLRLWPAGKWRPSLVLGVRGIGADTSRRLDSAMAGIRLGSVELGAGMGWAGGLSWSKPTPLAALQVPLWTDRAWIKAIAARAGPAAETSVTLGARPLSWLDLSVGWQRHRGAVLGMALRWDMAGMDRPWPLPARRPDGAWWSDVDAAMDPAESIAAAAFTGRVAKPATHRLGLPGIVAHLPALQVQKAARWDSSGAEIRRGTEFARAARPTALARHWEMALTGWGEIGPGPPETGQWGRRVGLDAGLTVLPVAGLLLHSAARTSLARDLGNFPQGDFAVGRADAPLYPNRDIRWNRGQGALLLTLAPPLDVMLEAGYLEEMFGGFGGELRYQPPLARWSVGVEAHRLWKRQPDGSGHLPNSRIHTAHLTLGLEGPGAESRLSLSAGRYLAGDWGAEMGVERWFGSGVALTAGITMAGEAPFARLGVRMPLGTIGDRVAFSVRGKVQPLGRWGGQRLDRAFMLGDLRRDAGYGRLLAGWDRAFIP